MRPVVAHQRAPDQDDDVTSAPDGSMEIEAKYRVADARVFERLRRMESLGEYALAPSPEREYQRNAYYDTPDRRLAAQRMSLRVREVGGARVATLKRSYGAAGAVHMREEWETPVGADLDPAAWPEGPARAALRGIGRAPLVLLFAIDTRRWRIGVLRNGVAIAELSLDEGSIRAGGRVLGFRELEVELEAGSPPDDLARLEALLSERFPLTPEPRGKRSRGVALLEALAATAAPGALLERAVSDSRPASS